MYRTPMYVNIYGSYKLSKNSPVFCPPCIVDASDRLTHVANQRSFIHNSWTIQRRCQPWARGLKWRLVPTVTHTGQESGKLCELFNVDRFCTQICKQCPQTASVRPAYPLPGLCPNSTRGLSSPNHLHPKWKFLAPPLGRFIVTRRKTVNCIYFIWPTFWITF